MLFSVKPFYTFSQLLGIKTEKNCWEEILLIFVPYVTQNTIGIIGKKLVIYKISGDFIFNTGESDAPVGGIANHWKWPKHNDEIWYNKVE